MDTKWEATLGIKMGKETHGEEPDRAYDSGACGRFSWKPMPGKPTQPPALMPHECPANNSPVPHASFISFVL
jgi:hypothetical protein